MNDIILNERLRRLRQHKRALEELKHSIDALEDEIKSEMEARGVDEIKTEDYKVTWKAVSSTRLDTRSLKEERPEIYSRYALTAETRRFVVQ